MILSKAVETLVKSQKHEEHRQLFHRKIQGQDRDHRTHKGNLFQPHRLLIRNRRRSHPHKDRLVFQELLMTLLKHRLEGHL